MILITWMLTASLSILIAWVVGIYDPDSNEYHPTMIALVNKEKRQEWLKAGIKIKDIFILLIAFILSVCALPIIIIGFATTFIYKLAIEFGNVTVFRKG